MPVITEQFTNFASSTVAGGAGGAGTFLNAGDTTLLLSAATGALFPATTTGTWKLLLGDPLGANEIVLVTNRTSDTLTVVRAQEGTTAQTWAFGTPVQAVVTAGSWQTLYNRIAAAPYYNVRDWGAKGDGVTNDTAAILAALTACGAAGGGAVYLPAGTYLVNGNNGTAAGGSTSLVIPATGNLTIRGDGPNETIIKHAGGNVNVLAAGTGAAVPNVTVRDLTINGNGCTGYGLIIQFADRCVFDNLIILGANALTTCLAVYDGTIGRNLVNNCRAIGGGATCLQGFEMGYGEIGTQMIGCTATTCLNGFQFDPGTNGLNGFNKHQFCRLDSCESYGNLSAGFNLSDMQDCEVVNCIAQGNTHFGLASGITNLTAATARLRITGGAYRANGTGSLNAGVQLAGNRSSIDGADISNNNNVGLALTSCASTLVEDCHFWDDQGSPTQTVSIDVLTAQTWGGLAVGNRFDATVTTAIGGAGATTGVQQIGNQGVNYVAQTAQTVTASPFTWTNTSGRPQLAIINGGTVSAVTIKRGAGANLGVFTASNNAILLGPGDLIVITYTVLPSLVTLDM